MGWHCSDTAELTFDDVRVPAGNIVGEVDGGFVPDHAASSSTSGSSLAAQAYATAQRALDLAVAYARERETFGKPLITRQVIRHKLVEMHSRTAAARALTRAGRRARPLAGDDRSGRHPRRRRRQEPSVAACEWVVSEAVQIFGGMGYMRESEIERHYRDARILGIGGGATEVMTDLAAKLMGLLMTTTTVDTDVRDRTRRNRERRCWSGSPTWPSSTPRRWPAAARSYVERHHQRGKLTARERIELLLDPDSPFLELSTLAAWGTDFAVGASIVTGIGVVEGVECMIVANDPTVKGGSTNPSTLQEGPPGGADRRRVRPADDQPGRVRRRRPADPEGHLHPRRRGRSATSPGPAPTDVRPSRWCSATRPPAARTSRA